jgi:GNAT superfamily N-acetyltransferase
MEIIKEATLEDIAQLTNLLTTLFTQEADFQPDRAKQEQGLRMIIESPSSGIIFVAHDGEEIVGMVCLLFTISTAEGGPVCWLEDMIVHQDYRSSGLGSRLLRHAISFARSNCFKRITLLTDRMNEGAIRFYGRHGFRPSEMSALRLYL